MSFFYVAEPVLSEKARDLVEFDQDSIRQVISGQHSSQPTIWLADAGQYEHNGRILRDSTSPRLLAYSPEDQILYATDGCNACVHRLAIDLKLSSKDQLHDLAIASRIRTELVEKMAALALSGS